jgi:hypothetical protein
MARKLGLTLKAREHIYVRAWHAAGLSVLGRPDKHDKKTASRASLGLSATKPLKTQAVAGLGVYMAAGVVGLSGLAVKSGLCCASLTG